MGKDKLESFQMNKIALFVLLCIGVESKVLTLPFGGAEVVLGGFVVMALRSPRIQGAIISQVLQTRFGKQFAIQSRSFVVQGVKNKALVARTMTVLGIQDFMKNLFSNANLQGGNQIPLYDRATIKISKEKIAQQMEEEWKDAQRPSKNQKAYYQATQTNVRATGLYQNIIQGIDPHEYAGIKGQLLGMKNERYKYWFEGFLGGIMVITLRDWLLKKEDKSCHMHAAIPGYEQRATHPMFLAYDQLHQ